MSIRKSPFKFLDAYQEEDIDLFYGREEETAALYEALSGVKHLLVYGPSGVGKTSLIECGLRNQFSDADWHAITIRKGDHIVKSVFQELDNALEEKLDIGDFHNLDFAEAIEQLFGELYQPIYLLFDQFEELFISGTEEEQRDFFCQTQ
jgi:AAA+ ATPase superfamily predicted ATPase